jgi:hypothetical protein
MTSIRYTKQLLDDTNAKINKWARQFERLGYQPHQAAILADLHIQRVKLERKIAEHSTLSEEEQPKLF